MRRPSPWLTAPALVAGTWLLSAQSQPSSAQLAELEKRVAELEARIAKAGNVTQVKAPFTVVGQDGRPILEVVHTSNLVSPGGGTSAAVIARHPGSGGALYAMDEAGKFKASLVVTTEGFGGVGVLTKAGKLAAEMTGQPVIGVWNQAGDPVAGMGVTAQDKGRFSILDSKQTRLVVIQDSAGTGNVTLAKSDGQPMALLGAGAGGYGRIAVMGTEGKIAAALLGNSGGGGLVAVATRGAQTVAQMGVSSDNRGLIQVFAPGGASLATMSQGGPGGGGILQVGNPGGVKATLATAEGGGGMLQLISSGGTPTVEAGTMSNGHGVVRVGPHFRCSPAQRAAPGAAVGFADCIVGRLAAQ